MDGGGGSLSGGRSRLACVLVPETIERHDYQVDTKNNNIRGKGTVTWAPIGKGQASTLTTITEGTETALDSVPRVMPAMTGTRSQKGSWNLIDLVTPLHIYKPAHYA